MASPDATRRAEENMSGSTEKKELNAATEIFKKLGERHKQTIKNLKGREIKKKEGDHIDFKV